MLILHRHFPAFEDVRREHDARFSEEKYDLGLQQREAGEINRLDGQPQSPANKTVHCALY